MEAKKTVLEAVEIDATRDIAQRLEALPPEMRHEVQNMMMGAITAAELISKQLYQQGGVA